MRTKTILIILTALVATGLVSGQKRGKPVKVSGVVTDTMMAPISNVLIVTDGHSTGVVTGKQGTYRLKVRPENRSLGAYTTNMGSAMTVIDGRNVINFVLDGSIGMPGFTPDASYSNTSIDIGYGTVEKKNLTTSVGLIDGQSPENVGFTNIYDMIQGKVPGVQVSGTKITIRGVNSINSGTEPLFVVDGIVVNTIDNISPRQVKSISVLKGSDASIYGSRAAGGVLLITLVGSSR